jgi:GTP-binding protein
VTAQFIKSAAHPRDFVPDTGREVAIVGRSNSGKSSAINAIFGSQKLARVSKTPGRTQLVNFFGLGEDIRFVDLPGYGFARVAPDVRRGWQTLMEGYFESRSSLKGLLITVDIRRGIMDLDETMLVWAAALEIPVVVLATKADKLSRNAGMQAVREMQKAAAVPLCRFSALSKVGIDAARGHVDAWLRGEESGPGRDDQGTRPGPK